MKIEQLFEEASLSPKILSIAIRAVRQQYYDEGHTLFDIGNGLCDEFVSDVYQYIQDEYNFDALRSKTLIELGTEDFCKNHYDDPHMDINLVNKYWNVDIPSKLKNMKFYRWFSGATHVWMYHTGTKKHYDATVPEGVDSFFDLPFFQNNLKKAKVRHLFERISNRLYFKNPSARTLQKYIDERAERFARAIVDVEGNFYIFNPYEMTHMEFRKHIGLFMGKDPLSGISLYAFKDTLACRLSDVEDEEIHPEMTRRVRTNKNIVRAYGEDVTCIDIHGDP